MPSFPPSYTSDVSNPPPSYASNTSSLPSSRSSQLAAETDTSSLSEVSISDTSTSTSLPQTTRYTYYRIYSDDDTMLEVVNRAYPADPFLGCVATFGIVPPHSVRNVRRQLSKWEGANTILMALYDPSREADCLGDGYPMLVWDPNGHGSTPACPLVLKPIVLPTFLGDQARREGFDYKLRIHHFFGERLPKYGDICYTNGVLYRNIMTVQDEQGQIHRSTLSSDSSL